MKTHDLLSAWALIAVACAITGGVYLTTALWLVGLLWVSVALCGVWAIRNRLML